MNFQTTNIIAPEEVFPLTCITEVVRVKQVVMERLEEYSFRITSTESAGELGMREIGDEAQEVMLLVALDTKNYINAIHRVFIGSLNTALAAPREFFRSALMNNAARVLIFHCHPSGDPSPSDADISVTRRFVQCGEILGIEVLDHIIVGRDSYVSLKEYGVI